MPCQSALAGGPDIAVAAILGHRLKAGGLPETAYGALYDRG
jgi:hypothetical protein